MLATDWATVSSLATAGGTLVLATATFASVRSANRSARIAEAAAYLEAAPTVVRVVRDAPVAEHDDRLPREAKDPVMATMLAEKFGVKAAMARVMRVLGER